MIDATIAKKLLRQMLYIRLVEERIAEEYAKQEMRCPTHLCIGQEAIPSGICAHLTLRDIVFSNHRSHGHYLAKGGNLRAMIAELYGKATGCSRGFGGSQHLIDREVGFCGSAPIVASTIPIAVGAAFAIAMKKEKQIVVSFFGDAAIEEGVFTESVNYAALKKLPILFVCENNYYSVSTHISQRQPKRPIYKIAQALGVVAHQGDGNDVLEVYRFAGRAIRAIRMGKGPQFLEFLTYRTREHCGPQDDPPGFRPEEEVATWKRKAPLLRLEKMLLVSRRMDTEEVERMKQTIAKGIDEAFVFAIKSPYARMAISEEMVYAR